jgi:hypothetical protein
MVLLSHGKDIFTVSRRMAEFGGTTATVFSVVGGGWTMELHRPQLRVPLAFF